MDTNLAHTLQRVGRAFRLPGPFFSYEEINRGNINTTYRVNYISENEEGVAYIKPYLFQKVNTYAFRHPTELMDNIDKITEYIRTRCPDRTTLHFHHVERDGRRLSYFDDPALGFWRVVNYVPSVTYDVCDDPAVIRSAGEAFGDFQTILKDFDPSLLHETIPGFHDTRRRYEALRQAAKEDKAGRAAEVREELDYLFSIEDEACRLVDLYEEGKLPLRVTHNDTKINNVLFDEHEPRALVVIDLDTVMPGLVGNDFGDASRFAANFTEEDSPDISHTGLDLNVFWAFTEGFLSRTADTLTPTEIDTLGLSCFALTVELAVRFLADYLAGDPYFKIKYPSHNFDRTRCQIALSRDMQNKREAMDSIVRARAAKYRRG